MNNQWKRHYKRGCLLAGYEKSPFSDATIVSIKLWFATIWSSKNIIFSMPKIDKDIVSSVCNHWWWNYWSKIFTLLHYYEVFDNMNQLNGRSNLDTQFAFKCTHGIHFDNKSQNPPTKLSLVVLCLSLYSGHPTLKCNLIYCDTVNPLPVSKPNCFNQWSPNKMADILQTTFSMHFLIWKLLYFA